MGNFETVVRALLGLILFVNILTLIAVITL